MARKIKIDSAALKKHSRIEKRRKINHIDKRIFYLIVCEGTKTEPNYFESLKKSLPKGILELANIDIDGTGKNTLSIIEESIKHRKCYEEKYLRKIDKVWAVFDRDSFPAVNFNNAIYKGENSKPKINCAWTNEAFELWYLLHFSYYNTGLSRSQYKKLLEKEINKTYKKKDFIYLKNSKEMFSILEIYGNLDFAIENAKKLELLYTDKNYSNHNPCTKVHKLIQELLKLSKKYVAQHGV
jgi:hypothetical protein